MRFDQALPDWASLGSLGARGDFCGLFADSSAGSGVPIWDTSRMPRGVSGLAPARVDPSCPQR